MTQPVTDSIAVPATKSGKLNPLAWYRPTFSPEHGVYVVLLVSFLLGTAATQSWTHMTTLALVCAFCGFQAEHPLVLQIKQRRSLKPRFLVWGGLYASVSLAIALYLALYYPVLLWLYGGAIAALGVDAVSVFWQKQKSVANELITFAAVCLSAPLAYTATTGKISTIALGLWILNTLFFSSAIFTVKLRKLKTSLLIPGLVYHAIATLIIAALYWFGVLPLITALAFGVVLLKFGLIVWQVEWYRTAPIQFVAMLETISAFSFLVIAALSVLPVRLTNI